MSMSRTELEMRANICRKIKNLYFEDEHWTECHSKVSEKFIRLRDNLCKFYPGYDMIRLIEEINRYTQDDIREALEN